MASISWADVSSGAPALGAQEGQVNEVAGLVILWAQLEPEAPQIQFRQALKSGHNPLPRGLGPSLFQGRSEPSGRQEPLQA